MMVYILKKSGNTLGVYYYLDNLIDEISGADRNSIHHELKRDSKISVDIGLKIYTIERTTLRG